jgi:transcription elongation factor GreA
MTIPTNINEAIEKYLGTLNLADTMEQAELRRFERWLGKSTLIKSLGPMDLERYGGRFSSSDPDCTRKLEIVRKFLTYARDQKWTAGNLAVHLKAKKGKSKGGGSTRTVKPEMSVLTRQGYDDIVTELGKLKAQRPQILEDIRRAAADKDFRENAPLHAAREQLGHVDGRVQELSAIVKSANIIGEKMELKDQVATGNTVVLVDNQSGQLIKYCIVGPKEANPAIGKISYVSPLGKAIMGKAKGEIVKVTTPSGNRHYRIEDINK